MRRWRVTSKYGRTKMSQFVYIHVLYVVLFIALAGRVNFVNPCIPLHDHDMHSSPKQCAVESS